MNIHTSIKPAASKPSVGINAGGAIIIIIITVLCICIFGVLSFISAYSDRKLADITRNSTECYYLAEKQMESDLALLDCALGQIGADESAAEYTLSDIADKLCNVSAELSDAQLTESDGGGMTIVNAVKFAGNRTLTAVFDIYKNSDGMPAFIIKSWRSSPNELPEYDQGIDLWDGES